MRPSKTIRTSETIPSVVHIWLPLGFSWFLMALEGPLSYALISRFPDPEISIAAFGGVALPMTFVIEAAILSLLSAATTLVKDLDSYRILRRFATYLAVFLSVLHLLVAFTPLFDFVTTRILGVPLEVKEAARLGFIFMSPVTAMVAYRRFHQGVLIAFGEQQVVGRGTVLRLVILLSSLFAGYTLGLSTGVAVAAFSVTLALSIEAVYIAVKVRPLVRGVLRDAPPAKKTVSIRKIATFYFPLALNVLLTLAVLPVYSAAISRMPLVIPSLATWAVVGALCFLVRSSGLALTEVTIAHSHNAVLDGLLKRFTYLLGAMLSSILLLIGASPLSKIYFHDLSGLEPELLELAERSVLILFAVPFLSTLECYFQGKLISAHRTSVITTSVVIGLFVAAIVLLLGIVFGSVSGTYIAALAVSFGSFARTFWLGSQAKKLPAYAD